MSTLFAILGLGAPELLVIAIVGVILFGKKLPEIGRSMGKTIVEFKKGMGGLEDGLEESIKSPTASAPSTPEAMRPPQRVGTTAPKFEDTPASTPQA